MKQGPTLTSVSDDDRLRWDHRYAGQAPVSVDDVALPEVFAPFADTIPARGHAVELACGRGGAAVWLARRGLDVLAVDVSGEAIAAAESLAAETLGAGSGAGGSCRFVVADLDGGLPDGPAADLILCHRFRDARLDAAILGRLAPGGLLAISVLSEVGAGPGPFRVPAGELSRAFASLEIIGSCEADGEAWLFARNPGTDN